MTQLTRDQLKQDAGTYLADNNSRQISPFDVRQRIIDLADSSAMRSEIPSGMGSGSVNPDGPITADTYAVFSDTTGEKIKSGPPPFDGDYNNLSNKPTLGTAAAQDSTAFQPSDADLTAIAALATTSFGRSFLTLADAAAALLLVGAQATMTKAGASDIRTGTDDAKYTTSKAIRDAMGLVALTDAATIAVDMGAGFDFSVTLGGNRTLGAPTNSIAGQSGFILIRQDGTGSRTLAFNAAWDFGGAGVPTATTTAGKLDILAYIVTTGGASPVIRASYLKGYA